MVHFPKCSLMAFLPNFEIFKCSPVLTLKCLADVPMYVSFISREQVDIKRPLHSRLASSSSSPFELD